MNRVNWPLAIAFAFLLAGVFCLGLAMSPHLVAECQHR